MSRKYKLYNPDGVYFASFAVKGRMDVFTWLLRPLATTYSLNGAAPVTLADNTGGYDALGRLATRKRHNGSDSESFAYNIRNWPTRITSGAFEEDLYYTQSVDPTADGCYNGNIAQTTWKYNGTVNNYKYSYDGLNRLTAANLFTNNTSGPKYNEAFSYDKQGNIASLTRFGSSSTSPIDYLTMTYNGNQVTRINDALGSLNSYSTKEYQNRSNADNEMAYDANGNLVKDLDRDIMTIRYNVLNLPDVIQFKNGNQIQNQYDAGGRKLKTFYLTWLPGATAPVVNAGDVLTISYSPSTIGLGGTFYVDNFEYDLLGGVGLSLSRIHNPEGYVENLAS